MATYVILGMTYAFAAAVQPGPLQAYLISQALSHGWRRTLPAALSPLISDGPIIALVLLALSRLPPWLIPTVRLAGGVLLLYLAFAAARTWKAQGSGQAAQKRAEPRSLLGATTVNLMNPGPYLGWSLIMGPLLLKGWREDPVHGIALLASFYSVMVLSLAGLIVLFAAARGLGPRVSRALVGVSALALAGLGCWQFWAVVAAWR
jgi:threonine/homoserine/homoserine lactone efflux protein